MWAGFLVALEIKIFSAQLMNLACVFGDKLKDFGLQEDFCHVILVRGVEISFCRKIYGLLL